MKIFRFEDRDYTPCTPIADSDELAGRGPRLILVHNDALPPSGSPTLLWVEKDELSRGWVIGLAS